MECNLVLRWVILVTSWAMPEIQVDALAAGQSSDRDAGGPLE